VVVADPPDATPVLIRAVRPDDDLDAQFDLAVRSFGPASRAGRDQRRRAVADPIAAGRTLGAFHGDRPVGAATFHDMRQWWCGRAVPMAGVASVKVAPEDRGRDVRARGQDHGIGRHQVAQGPRRNHGRLAHAGQFPAQ
jgi:hypothetical protein